MVSENAGVKKRSEAKARNKALAPQASRVLRSFSPSPLWGGVGGGVRVGCAALTARPPSPPSPPSPPPQVGLARLAQYVAETRAGPGSVGEGARGLC